ncbi:hypothetical protein DL93DRAFT_2166946 [Clavulina sp. PMI_390]|nr:hypothetical protein DL93DRAFT_2166946 [Clavulina sp. PMI_390]
MDAIPRSTVFTTKSAITASTPSPVSFQRLIISRQLRPSRVDSLSSRSSPSPFIIRDEAPPLAPLRQASTTHVVFLQEILTTTSGLPTQHTWRSIIYPRDADLSAIVECFKLLRHTFSTPTAISILFNSVFSAASRRRLRPTTSSLSPHLQPPHLPSASPTPPIIVLRGSLGRSAQRWGLFALRTAPNRESALADIMTRNNAHRRYGVVSRFLPDPAQSRPPTLQSHLPRSPLHHGRMRMPIARDEDPHSTRRCRDGVTYRLATTMIPSTTASYTITETNMVSRAPQTTAIYMFTLFPSDCGEAFYP